jgi:WD40 repeat protein
MADLPVILLAFANEQEGHRYLRDLPEELRRLQEILEAAERRGLCKLVVRPNASLKQIFDTFTEHRDRVAVLHYGGHAGSDRLFLEMASPGHEGVAHAEGLATFFGQRRNLRLIFLNGCSTRAQAAALLDGGVGAVIATARAIDDAVACDFAAGFYSELASGATLRAAYEATRGRLLTSRGDVPRDYFRTRDLVAEENPEPSAHADERGFPWELRLATGAELDGRWSLPEAAGNPLFGLPLPSADLLPVTPYRGLERFTHNEAEVFFGRGRAISELYHLATDPGTRPVILYYGPTGVGKSSVLDAGVGPRLAASHDVLYLRRKPDLGSLETLCRELSPAGPSADAASRADLARLWRNKEQPGRPLIAILDQAEEIFTRPHVFVPSADDREALERPWIDPGAELAELLSALRATFTNPDPGARPSGKLILSFRNEWLDRFEQAFNTAKLAWEPMPLNPLDRTAIVEAIEGPTRNPTLMRLYGVTVEEGLAASIAEDLVADAGSAVAPTLQVLLSTMWKRAGGKGSRFDQVLYKRLRDEGYLLGDVLDKGLEAVRAWRRDAEESGLALDVLAFHVTEFDTAATRTRAAVEARYPHRADLLRGLLSRLVNAYLLIEADDGLEPASPSVPAVRLAHDTLAPLVHARFRASGAPGQRARRILEIRAPEWQDGKTGHVLGSPDLGAVKDGRLGMRIWTADEARLVEASRLAEEKQRAREQKRERRLREAEERRRQAEAETKEETERRLKEQEKSNQRLRQSAARLKRALAFAATIALLAIGAAWLAAQKRQEAIKATGIANEKTEQANKAAAKEAIAAGIAKLQTQLAEERLKTATSRQFAALSATERSKRLDLSLLLAIEALRIKNTLEARDSLYKALQERPRLRCFLHSVEGTVRSVAFSPDGKTLAAGFGDLGFDGSVVLWDVVARRRVAEEPLPVKEGSIWSVAFSPDGKILAAGFSFVRGAGKGSGGGVVFWDVAARQRLAEVSLPGTDGFVRSVAFSPDGKTLAIGFVGGMVLWEVAARERLADGPLPINEREATSVAFSPDGKTLAAGVIDPPGITGGVVLWDVAARRRLTGAPLPVKEGRIESIAFSPDGKTLAAGYAGVIVGSGGVVLWDVTARGRLAEVPIPVKKGAVKCVAFSVDGRTLAAGYNGDFGGGALLWEVASGGRLVDEPLPVGERTITSIAFGPDGTTLATGFGGGVVLWDVVERQRLADEPLPVKDRDVTSVTFSPDGKTLAAGIGSARGAIDGRVMLWNAAARQILADESFPVKEGPVQSVAFSPDGKTLAAGFGLAYASGALGVVYYGGVVLWDAAARGRLVDEPLPVKERPVRSVAFSPDGRTLAAGFGDFDFDGGVVLWDVIARTRLGDKPLPVNEGSVTSVAFSPDSRTLAAGFDFVRGGRHGGGVVLWDVAARRRLADDPLRVKEGPVRSIAFSPDGKTLAAECGVGVVLWNAAARSRLTDEPLNVNERFVVSVAFSPNSKTLAAGIGTRLASGVLRGGVVLWDVATRERLADEPLPVQEGRVRSVAFSPDGRTLAAAYHGDFDVGGGVVLWNVDLQSWQGLAAQIANRNFTSDERRQYFPDDQ